MRTYQPKGSDIARERHTISAEGAVLGRLSTRIATLLMGKHKPTYSAHLDSGDYVVVLNVEKITVTGQKEKQKVYQKHSGYPGGFKEVTYARLKAVHPERILEHAVKGMLPDNRLKAKRMARLKLIVGNTNPYGN